MRRTAIIGPGRVGTALAMALVAAGYRVEAVAGRGADALAAFLARVPGARAYPTAADAAADAELVVLCVPEGVLGAVVRELVVAEAVGPGVRVVHVAGGSGTAVLEPLRLAGASVAACHPAQTFADADRGRDSLPGTTWAVTAAPSAIGWASVLVTDVRGTPLPVTEEDRARYSAGLAVGADATSSIVTMTRAIAAVSPGEPGRRTS